MTMGVVLVVVGYVIGVFAASNIVLPLLWAWPKARRLERVGGLTSPIPTFRFVVNPLLWTVMLFGTYFVATRASNDAAWYAAGLTVAFAQIVRLLFSPNLDMEADFKSAYAGYLR
jgi:hypothetical protein